MARRRNNRGNGNKNKGNGGGNKGNNNKPNNSKPNPPKLAPPVKNPGNFNQGQPKGSGKNNNKKANNDRNKNNNNTNSGSKKKPPIHQTVSAVFENAIKPKPGGGPVNPPEEEVPGADQDGDGTPDAIDTDDDNDGILDQFDGDSIDSDGDGVPDGKDGDDDNDGVLDYDDPDHPDFEEEEDEEEEVVDDDDDDDGIPNAAEPVLDTLQSFLDQWGLGDLTPFIRDAIIAGKSQNEILLELRQHPVYLAAFPENNLRKGKGFSAMTEGEILAYRNEAKRIAKQFGFQAPSNNYIADAIGAGVSLGELEQRFGIVQQVNRFGGGVKMVLEDRLGKSLSDEDLYEFFDPNVDTAEWDEAYLDALYQGRPMMLGLGIRSQAEADALQMLGVDPDEAFRRYQEVGQNRSRFERLASIQDNLLEGLPENFGAHLKDVTNGLLIQGLLFQSPDALKQLQDLTMQEMARFKSGGGVASQGTQAVGLLTANERATG